MRRAILGAAVAAALSLRAAAVGAAADDVTRPCRQGDLIGTWMLAQLRVPPGTHVDRSDPAFVDYQAYKFDLLGTFRYVASRVPFAHGARETVSAAPARGAWRIDERGWVTVTRTDGTIEWTAECRAVTDLILKAHDDRAPSPGDVLLTFDSPVRHRRHLMPPPER